MKKIFAFVLALLLLCGSVAVAEVSLAQYTAEELLALRDQINQELLKRGIENKVLVPIGNYIGGVDIPAGDYTITCAENGSIFIYPDEEEANKGGWYTFFAILSENEKAGKMTVKEGDFIKIMGGSFYFAPYQGLGF